MTTYEVKLSPPPDLDGQQIYEVIEIHKNNPNAKSLEYPIETTRTTVFIGNLSNCDAYINLKQKGYLI